MKDHKSKLIDYFRTNHRLPSYSEMMTIFGYKTKSAVAYAVNKLIEEGVILRDQKGKLSPTQLVEGIKFLGLVQAGFPSPAEEELIDTMSLDDYLIKNKDASYILRVKGDSMEDAGILEGDMVIVERGKKPKVGDIVIAQIDGEYTMKYFRTKNGQMYLEPANKKYQPIYPDNELKIDAIVKAIIRKY